MYLYIYIYIYMYIYIKYIYIFMYIYMYIYIYIYINTNVCAEGILSPVGSVDILESVMLGTVYDSCIYVCIHVCMDKWIDIYGLICTIYKFVKISMYIYIHV
jgi:hypothetical protein